MIKEAISVANFQSLNKDDKNKIKFMEVIP